MQKLFALFLFYLISLVFFYFLNNFQNKYPNLPTTTKAMFIFTLILGKHSLFSHMNQNISYPLQYGKMVGGGEREIKYNLKLNFIFTFQIFCKDPKNLLSCCFSFLFLTPFLQLHSKLRIEESHFRKRKKKILPSPSFFQKVMGRETIELFYFFRICFRQFLSKKTQPDF